MDSDKVILVGQVLNSADPDERLADVSVTLRRAAKFWRSRPQASSVSFKSSASWMPDAGLVVMLPGKWGGNAAINRSGLSGVMRKHRMQMM